MKRSLFNVSSEEEEEYTTTTTTNNNNKKRQKINHLQNNNTVIIIKEYSAQKDTITLPHNVIFTIGLYLPLKDWKSLFCLSKTTNAIWTWIVYRQLLLCRQDIFYEMCASAQNIFHANYILTHVKHRKDDILDITATHQFVFEKMCRCGSTENIDFLIKKYEITKIKENVDKGFYLASEYGNVSAVKFMLTNKLVNQFDNDHKAMIIAIKYNRLEIVKLLLLLDHGPIKNESVDIPIEKKSDIRQMTYLALDNNAIDIAKYLISTYKIILNSGYHNDTILRDACKLGWKDIVVFFLESEDIVGEIPPKLFNILLPQDALMNGYMELTKILLCDSRTNINNFFEWCCRGVGHSDKEFIIIKLLLSTDKRLDINLTVNNMLPYLCRIGSTKIIEILLSDERVRPSFDCLTEAIEKDNDDIVRLLLNDKRITNDISFNKFVLVSVAINKGSTAAAEVLLTYFNNQSQSKSINTVCADDNKIPKHLLDKTNTRVCLITASKLGHIETVKILLQCNYYIDPSLKTGALMVACENKQIKIVELLLQDTNLSITISELNNCLWRACSQNQIEMTKILLNDCRVDPSESDNRCIRQSCALEYYDIVYLLINNPRFKPIITVTDNNKHHPQATQLLLLLLDK